jgi:hypothetical protein
MTQQNALLTKSLVFSICLHGIGCNQPKHPSVNKQLGRHILDVTEQKQRWLAILKPSWSRLVGEQNAPNLQKRCQSQVDLAGGDFRGIAISARAARRDMEWKPGFDLNAGSEHGIVGARVRAVKCVRVPGGSRSMEAEINAGCAGTLSGTPDRKLRY